MSLRMFPVIVFVLLSDVIFGLSNCPGEYLQLHRNHSYCLNPNPKCNILEAGVGADDQELIVRMHNKLRNDVALGKETEAVGGTLHEASDMMELAWDKELQKSAQRWSENCTQDHDCIEGCRSMRSYEVGQNIWMSLTTCPISGCKPKEIQRIHEAEWGKAINIFHNQVTDFNKGYITKYDDDDERTEDFSQLIWSKTYKIGCGFTLFIKNGIYYRFYVCNYAPKGNIVTEQVYETGEPCSACPKNTCCGSECVGKTEFTGLCRLLHDELMPIYPKWPLDLPFYCTAFETDGDCQFDEKPEKLWNLNLKGYFRTITLEGGQEALIKYRKQIKPPKPEFCIVVKYRKMNCIAGEKDESIFTIELENKGVIASDQLKTTKTYRFLALRVIYTLDEPIKTNSFQVKLNFTVPQGKSRHSFDFQHIQVVDCEETTLSFNVA